MCGMARLLELTGGFVSPRILSAISRPQIAEIAEIAEVPSEISELRCAAPEPDGFVNAPPSAALDPHISYGISHGSPLREVSPPRAPAGGGALSARASPMPLQNLENLRRAGAWLRPVVSVCV